MSATKIQELADLFDSQAESGDWAGARVTAVRFRMALMAAPNLDREAIAIAWRQVDDMDAILKDYESRPDTPNEIQRVPIEVQSIYCPRDY